jgi:hypothetical protein
MPGPDQRRGSPTHRSRAEPVRIDKQHVVQTLRSQGLHEQARRAEEVFGPEVDSQDDGDLLRELGLDPESRAAGGRMATLPHPEEEP